MVKKFVLVFSLLIFSSIIYPQSKNNYKLLGGELIQLLEPD